MRTAAVIAIVLGACLAVYAAPPPSIDASLDDPFWSINGRTWTVQDSKHPERGARFLLGYDERFLYVGADVVDTNVVGTHRRRKDATWLDDSVEFYIDFGSGAAAERTPETYQYTFSAAGGVSWTRGTGDGSGRHYPAHDWPADWNSQLEWAVRLRPGTTLNNPADRDTGYAVEARIPLNELGRKGPLRPDSTVGVCFVNINRPEDDHPGSRPLSNVPGLTFAEIHNPQRWQRIRLDWQAPFAIRGLAIDLPDRAEQADDAFRWGRGAGADTDWLNQEGWTSQLGLIQKHGLNALLLTHPDLKRLLPAPATASSRERELFRWLLGEARAHGVRVYLACGDAYPSPIAQGGAIQSAASQPASTQPADAQMVTAQQITELARGYPELGGLAVIPPEGVTNSSEWLLQAAKALHASASRPAAGGNRPDTGPGGDGPELLAWVREERPEVLARVLEIYPHTRLVYEFQEGPWSSPEVDPAAARLVAGVGAADQRVPRPAVSCVAVGGPGRASEHLFWGDPAWMRNVSLSLRRNGLDGMFLRPDSADPWLAVEAWGAYALQSGDVFNDRRWRKRLDEVYGVGEYSGQLLEAMQRASAILPRFCSLINGCSQRFTPQLGLPLIYALGLPTATTAGEPNAPQATTRPAGVGAVSRMPWVKPIASIPEDVNLLAPAGAVGPDKIAEQIGEDAAACRSLLTGLRHVHPPTSPQEAGLARLLDGMELSAELGEYYQHWILAGVGWEQFRTLRAQSVACASELQKAQEAWTAASRTASRLHPEAVRFWELQMASPPPWTRSQILRSYRPAEGHWRDQAKVLEREVGLIRRLMGTEGPNPSPLPGWDVLHAWPREQLQGLFRLSFGPGDERRFRLGPGGGQVTAEGIAIQGVSLLVNTRELGSGWHHVFETEPAAAPIPLGRPLEIVFQYRVLQPSKEDPEPFMASIRTASGGPPLGDLPRWGGPVGYDGTRVIKVPPLQGGPYVVSIDVLGEAAIVIDEIRLETLKTTPASSSAAHPPVPPAR